MLTPFHLAIPVRDIAEAREFYGGLLGCEEGRSAEQWVDFNLFGHQLVCHLDPALGERAPIGHHNPVDGHQVPVPHFGVVLEMPDWRRLADRLTDAGEQATLFFRDPSGNALEFKSFRDIAGQLFAH